MLLPEEPQIRDVLRAQRAFVTRQPERAGSCPNMVISRRSWRELRASLSRTKAAVLPMSLQKCRDTFIKSYVVAAGRNAAPFNVTLPDPAVITQLIFNVCPADAAL